MDGTHNQLKPFSKLKGSNIIASIFRQQQIGSLSFFYLRCFNTHCFDRSFASAVVNTTLATHTFKSLPKERYSFDKKKGKF